MTSKEYYTLECPNCRSLAVERAETSATCHSCAVSWEPSHAIQHSTHERQGPTPARLWSWLACSERV